MRLNTRQARDAILVVKPGFDDTGGFKGAAFHVGYAVRR